MFRLSLLVALMAMWRMNDALESVTCSSYGISNCGACDIPDVDCYSCGEHYIMNDDFSGCTACPSNCHTCEWSSTGTTTVCTLCEGGYILRKDGSCASCGSYCETCHWADNSQTTVVCDECTTNEGITLGALSLACLTCGSNCRTCSEKDKGATTCSACYDYYFLSGSSCIACPSNCKSCSASTTPSKGSCNTCKTGYVVNSADPTKACLSCPIGCSSCSGEVQAGTTSKCTACKEGYYLDDSAGTCNECNDGCATCSDASTCDSCEDYYALEGSSCSECESKCITCSINDGEETCSVCVSGWGVQGDVSSCATCPSNCITCSDPFTCTKCKSGYYINGDGVCAACLANCDTCSSTTTCTTCKDGYAKKTDGSACLACDSNCDRNEDGTFVDCSYNDATSKALCTCKDGYYYDNVVGSVTYTCKTCPGNCLLCDTDPAKCDDGNCKETYYKKVADGLCYTCPSNCLACTTDAGAKCDDGKCKSTYYKKDADGLCYSCPSNCLQCDTENTKCDAGKCAEGYYRTVDGLCSGCKLSKCKTCSSNTDCSVCKTGYFAYNDNCYAYGTCLTASYDTDAKKVTCSSCDAAKYYVLNSDDSLCYQCPEHCTACVYNDDNSALLCTDCASGYGLINDLCEACPNFCVECSVPDEGSTLVCDTCKEAYITNDLNCGQCPPNCLECSNQDGSMICTTCKDAYALTSEGTCLACPANCKVCQAQGTKTICNSGQCITGYGRSNDGTSCVACSSLAFANCDDCSDANSAGVAVCNDCSNGFILDFWQTVCLSTSGLSNCAVAGSNGQFARPVECSSDSCQSPFSWIEEGPAKGLCGISCAICGDIDTNDFRAADECQSSSANYTQMLHPDGCWVARKLVNGVAMYARGGTFNYNCTKDYSNEVVTSDGTSLICCSSGDNCNANLQLDGVAGASSVTISIALLIASIFAMISNLF